MSTGTGIMLAGLFLSLAILLGMLVFAAVIQQAAKAQRDKLEAAKNFAESIRGTNRPAPNR